MVKVSCHNFHMKFITTLGEYQLRLGYLPISFPWVIYPYSLWTQPSPYGYLAISLRQLTFPIEIAKNTSKLWVKQVFAIWLWFPYLILQTTLFFLVHLLWCKRYGYPSLHYLSISVFFVLISLVYGHPFYLEWLLE